MRRLGVWLLVPLVAFVLTVGTALGAPERVTDRAGALSASQRIALTR
jgi:uncharacterized membrane protein YgcG